ncbi:MAG: ATP-dependent zinc protease [Methanobrevibacter arboriphilus]|uniref:ATP-dependent zinc protease n=1 Tax=Methanobrevibacter arboriphilus TaxID=39441 RepID=A0A843AR75_METAZ|nr:RimK/LysX family protein [Methanobrevibacter arboriphilus]MBF4469250.1 ATP-dependent zinc protease [Methanobrevibacter arboriphilus]
MEKEDIKKILTFTIKEKEIIRELNLPEEIFLPLFFSVRFGGDWSVNKNSKKLMSIKEKVTEYDKKTKIGYTLEKIYLFVNPEILSKEGKIYRMEKCGNKNERELVERPYITKVNGEYILEAILNPKDMEISVKHLEGPLNFYGPAAYGSSHEMEHLENNKTQGIPFWNFKYILKH